MAGGQEAAVFYCKHARGVRDFALLDWPNSPAGCPSSLFCPRDRADAVSERRTWERKQRGDGSSLSKGLATTDLLLSCPACTSGLEKKEHGRSWPNRRRAMCAASASVQLVMIGGELARWHLPGSLDLLSVFRFASSWLLALLATARMTECDAVGAMRVRARARTMMEPGATCDAQRSGQTVARSG